MLPQKKDNSLEAILETIRRGDKFDYEDIVTRVEDELRKSIVTNETFSLCCDVIEVLLEKNYKGPFSPPLELCTKIISGCDDDHSVVYMFHVSKIHADTAARVIDIFHRGLKKEIKRGTAQKVLEGMAFDWLTDNAVRMCARDESSILLKACMDLCGTLAKTSEAEAVSNFFIEAIELDTTCPRPLSPGGLPYEVAYLVPFTKSTDKRAAARAKKCLKDFFENFSPSEGQEETQIPLLGDVRKQISKLRL